MAIMIMARIIVATMTTGTPMHVGSMVVAEVAITEVEAEVMMIGGMAEVIMVIGMTIMALVTEMNVVTGTMIMHISMMSHLELSTKSWAICWMTFVVRNPRFHRWNCVR